MGNGKSSVCRKDSGLFLLVFWGGGGEGRIQSDFYLEYSPIIFEGYH
jgi:hypothetical protein